MNTEVMKKVISLFLFVAICSFTLSSQNTSIEFCVYNEADRSGIFEADVFVGNSTFSTKTGVRGACVLTFPIASFEDIIVYKKGFKPAILPRKKYNSLQLTDSIFLTPLEKPLRALSKSQKKKTKWNKKYKQFKKGFLGEGKAAAQCKILNPEILRFKQKKEAFEATAHGLLIIRNEHLGYNIHYLLHEFVSRADGSMVYRGSGKFEEIETLVAKPRVQEIRQKTYKESPTHFYYHLIRGTLDEAGYEINIVQIQNNQFKHIVTPEPENIITYDSISSVYNVKFPEFLQITNRNVDLVDLQNSEVVSGEVDFRRISDKRVGATKNDTFAKSQIYKLSNALKLLEDGNLLNSLEVQEFGFWADQRMAKSMPVNFSLH